MTDPLDLHLLPLARYSGRDIPELAGLYADEPPRRSARGRGSDRLILYLAVAGDAPLPPSKQDQILADLARLFYRTPGSVTAAMRAVAEELNRLLLDRNMRIASKGRQGLGVFTQLVVRDQQLYLASSGPARAYLISAQGTHEFYNPESEGRALGQGRALPISYYRAALNVNDTLLLAALPPASWTAEQLNGMRSQGLESLRRRLFGQTEVNFNALLIQAKTGQGKIYLPRIKSEMVTSEAPAPSVAKETTLVDQTMLPPAVEDVSTQNQVSSSPARQSSPTHIVDTAAPPASESQTTGVQPSHPPSLPESTARPRAKVNLAPVGKAAAAVGTPVAKGIVGVLQALRKLFARMLPSETFAAIPSSVMAFIAVAVPVIIVTVASVVYFRLGRAAQYETLFTQAEQLALQAAAQTDWSAQRTAWQAVLEVLDRLESYQGTAETQALRVKAWGALDTIDLIQRVDYRPAIYDGLPVTVNVTRMVVSDNDLYMLDSTSGNVMRARATSRGFEIDYSFQCGPDTANVTLDGPIVDLVVWPPGFEPTARVLALGASGYVLYCQPDNPPSATALTPPPNATLQSIKGFALDLIDIYVLDPTQNAVWIYYKSDFAAQPFLYFDEQIPRMDDVIGLAVNNEELYLLHSDGHLSLCYLGVTNVTPTRCSDPPYIDFRLGRENKPMVLSNPLAQINFTLPPDPSLYLLEPQEQAIYHFSLRNLAFQRQYRPQGTLPGQAATAFFIHQAKRSLFLAIGNQVFYAAMP